MSLALRTDDTDRLNSMHSLAKGCNDLASGRVPDWRLGDLEGHSTREGHKNIVMESLSQNERCAIWPIPEPFEVEKYGTWKHDRGLVSKLKGKIKSNISKDRHQKDTGAVDIDLRHQPVNACDAKTQVKAREPAGRLSKLGKGGISPNAIEHLIDDNRPVPIRDHDAFDDAMQSQNMWATGLLSQSRRHGNGLADTNDGASMLDQTATSTFDCRRYGYRERSRDNMKPNRAYFDGPSEQKPSEVPASSGRDRQGIPQMEDIARWDIDHGLLAEIVQKCDALIESSHFTDSDYAHSQYSAYSGKGKESAAKGSGAVEDVEETIRVWFANQDNQNADTAQEQAKISGKSWLEGILGQVVSYTSGLLQGTEQKQIERCHSLDVHISKEDLSVGQSADEQEASTNLIQELPQYRECAVCSDKKITLDFPLIRPTRECNHPPETCVECMQIWMAIELESKGCEGIACPQCSQMMGHNEIQNAASAATFETYDRLATRNALSALEDFAWCLFPGCQNGQLNIGLNHYMKCASCKYAQCLKHKIPWHKGETCDEYEYRKSGQKVRDQERATEAMIDTISKLCPNPQCKWRIQKIDGCDHMTCKQCKYQFCWLCLASHAEIKRIGNTAHASTCKYHTNNLNIAWPFNVH